MRIKRDCSTAVEFRSLYLEVRRAVPRGGTCTGLVKIASRYQRQIQKHSSFELNDLIPTWS